MLPDLRIVIVAVISTFLFTVGVGFYTSSRFIIEPRKSDALAALDDSPINRIALNWPEPVQQAKQLDLDFAVTLNGSRNPVRDVTSETTATHAELQRVPARSTTTDSVAANPAATDAASAADKQADKAAVRDQNDEPSQPIESAAQKEAASVQTVQDASTVPVRELSPPIAGLSLTVKGVEAIVVPAIPVEDRTTTASIAAKPEISAETAQTEAQKSEIVAQTEHPAPKAEVESTSQPIPETTGTIALPKDNIPLPQARPARTAPGSKKAVTAAKRAKKSARNGKRAQARPIPPAPKVSFPFNLFTQQQNSTNSSAPAAPIASTAQTAKRP